LQLKVRLGKEETMRHYDRVNFRHLNDSERYRDYDYLADDAWVGPNERVPHGAMDENEPPWSTLGGYETGPFLDERAFDARRGQGRDYGRDMGLGYGREHDVRRSFERDGEDDYDRGYGRPRDLTHHLEYPREGFDIDERTQHLRPAMRARPRSRLPGGEMVRGIAHGVRDVREVVRHPGGFVRRMVRGIFHGKGPKNWLRSDTRIHDEVCELLAEHPEIDASEIDVVVKDGEVTLEGSVPDRRTKRLADEVLDHVLGLHDVHNRLTVTRASSTTTSRSETSANGNGNGSRQLSGSQGANTTTGATRR
jgi:hypothetical protein